MSIRPAASAGSPLSAASYVHSHALRSTSPLLHKQRCRTVKKQCDTTIPKGSSMSSNLSNESSRIGDPAALGANDAVSQNGSIDSLDVMDGFSVDLSVRQTNSSITSMPDKPADHRPLLSRSNLTRWTPPWETRVDCEVHACSLRAGLELIFAHLGRPMYL